MTNSGGGEEAKQDSPIGRVLARRYKVISALGEGGIGAVYKGEDIQLKMQIAIKMLKKEVAEDPEVIARFDREAKTMTALTHENLVKAYIFGRTPEGDIILVMELVQGENLRSVIRAKRPAALTPDIVAPIAMQMGAAMMKAHSMGVVHRDLKPENVMIVFDAEGKPKVKVLDFGMARIVAGPMGEQSNLTRKGQVFGTPEYMSPEQSTGQSTVGAPTDQYALGVILYEMLCAQRPYKASSPLEMIQHHIRSPVPRIEAVKPDVLPGTGDVLAKMMAKKPEDRFADVGTAVEALVTVWGMGPRASAPPEEKKSFFGKLFGKK